MQINHADYATKRWLADSGLGAAMYDGSTPHKGYGHKKWAS